MAWILLMVLLFAILLGPSLWVRRVMRRYAAPPDRYRDCGTGADLARHLLARQAIHGVTVEATAAGDHYDPAARAVRLSEENFNGASLTAVTVAAHEVGHAVQHARGERLFSARHRLAQLAVTGQRAAGLLLVAAPFAVLLTRIPHTGALFLLLALASATLGALVHLVTLPVEFDASFNKALPMLDSGRHLHDGDLPHARRILKAAALTYVAGSLMGLLNLARWLAELQR